MKIANQKSFVVGLMYVLVGLGFSGIAATYRMGTAARMGPGYFPFWLGIVLAVLGAILLINAISRPAAPDERLEKWNVKGLIIILASVCVFAALLQPMGLVVSLIVLIIGSSFADDEFSWLTTIVNVAVLLAISLAVFVYGLGLQFPIWPTLFTD